jgi:hypothetical protein
MRNIKSLTTPDVARRNKVRKREHRTKATPMTILTTSQKRRGGRKDALSYALRFLLTDDWSKCQHDIAECVREEVSEMRQCSDEAIVTKDTVRAFLRNPKCGSTNPQDWTNW